ncbi:MAG: sulfotransferase family 2 domain-containing protein [Woeseiaceae bacterium]|nr:sulfotransferase family 2 domain-containing protein [Woeseiaceae bacterium]
MRLAGSKEIEGVLKDMYNFTYLGKAIHRLRNVNRRNAVFIWIPKNAGTSLYSALRPYGCMKAKKLARVKYRFSQQGLVTFAHMDYHELVRQGHVKREFDRTAFKFCFCRNPYDRAISVYTYLMAVLGVQTTFLDFWRDVQINGVESIGLHNGHDTLHCNAQVRWIEKLDIDFVGRFETLDEDFARLTGQLDLSGAELERLNSSRRKPVADYFCRQSKQIIEDLYAEDFDYFGYRFETDEDLGIRKTVG